MSRGLEQISADLHAKTKEFETAIEEMGTERETYEIAECNHEKLCASTYLIEKAKDPKYSDIRVKSIVVEKTWKEKLELIKAESKYKKSLDKVKVLQMQHETLEIESNNERAELKKFGG